MQHDRARGKSVCDDAKLRLELRMKRGPRRAGEDNDLAPQRENSARQGREPDQDREAAQQDRDGRYSRLCIQRLPPPASTPGTEGTNGLKASGQLLWRK